MIKFVCEKCNVSVDGDNCNAKALGFLADKETRKMRYITHKNADNLLQNNDVCVAKVNKNHLYFWLSLMLHKKLADTHISRLTTDELKKTNKLLRYYSERPQMFINSLKNYHIL